MRNPSSAKSQAPPRTIFFPDEGFVYDVMVIRIQVDIVVMKVKVDNVYHGREQIVIARRTRTPIFPQVREQVDVIPQQI